MEPHGAAATRKRGLGEVSAPAFVARKQDGAYDIGEMPKRYMLGYMAEKQDYRSVRKVGQDDGDEDDGHKQALLRKLDAMMAVFQALDAETTAANIRVHMFAAGVIRMMDAEDAARAAAAAGQDAHEPS